MDTMHALKSTLRFSSRAIPANVVREIIRSAMISSHRSDAVAFQFVVIDDRSILDDIPNFHSSAQMVLDAPIAILICGEHADELGKDAWFRECLAISEHLLIAVQAHGLGALRLSIYPVDERIDGMQSLLGLPRTIIPVSLIPIGYPLDDEGYSSRRYNGTKVHYNHW